MGKPRLGDTGMTSKDAAKALGTTPRNLRLWIVKGLVPPAPITRGGPGSGGINFFTPEWVEEAKRSVEARNGHGGGKHENT